MEESKSILHELYVFSEWKPEPEYLQKPDNILSENISTLWKWLKFFGPKKSLFDSVTAHKENQQKWHIALGDEGKVIAIVADNILEIRTKRSEYATIAARTTVARDPYPQWRKLVWSPDCSFLVLAYGNGVVSFFDLTASNLFNIPADCSRPGGLECTDNTHAVVDIIFMPLQVKDNKWSYEVAIVTYDGGVRGYRVSQSAHGQAARAQLASAVSSVAHLSSHACLIAATVPSDQNPNTPLGAGLTSWRILNDEPYYKLSVVSDQLEMQLANKKFQLYIPFVSRKNMVIIVEMALSPDQSKLVCLHCNGEVSIWSLPLLKLLFRFPLATQPQHDLRNPLLPDEKLGKRDLSLFHPAAVNWWSNDEIILSRFSGVVTVCNIKDMINLLGKKPEFFQGAPRVTCAHHGSFMVLECECNIVPAKKSYSDESMEVVRVEEDLEDSFLETSKELIKSIMYAITDMETFQPKPKRISVATRIYRLLGVKSTTPQDLFARKIESGNYKEALALAEEFNLDSDQVYQQQWRKSPVSKDTIENYLKKVSSKVWAVHQCVDRLPECLSAAAALLSAGLALTHTHILSGECLSAAAGLALTHTYILSEINKDREEPITDPEDITLEDLNAYTTELLRCRHVMLFYKERLHLYEAILKLEKSTYDKEEYDRLRSSSIVHSAIEIAKEGRIKALTCLWPQIKTLDMQLAVLEKLPETINPMEYQHLLPTKEPIELIEPYECEIEIPEIQQESDWCRKEIFRSIWSSNWSEDLSPDAETPSFSMEEIHKWYEKRARGIEELSGLVSHALTLVTLASVGGAVKGLEEIMFHLVNLDVLVYEVNVENVTLKEIESMSSLKMCALLMSMSTPESFVSDLKKFVVPYLKRYEILTRRQYVCLTGLMDYLENISINDLSYILLVLQSPKQFELDVRTHLELVERCLYAYDGTDQLDMACDLLHTMLSESDGSIAPSELVRRVSEAQRVVAASSLLAARGVASSRPALRAPTPAQARALLARAAAASDDEKRTKEEWDKLLSDLMELQQTVFGCISVQEVYEIYGSALLTSGDSSSIKMAEHVLTCARHVYDGGHLVPYAQSVEIVKKAAKQYFNSASSLTDPALELAKCCLQLIKEDDPEICQELDLISALYLLSSFKVELLPIQVRLREDKMTLIEECIKADGTAYNASHKLLKLAKMLRVAGNDEQAREAAVLTVVLGAALGAGAGAAGAVTAAARRLAELRHAGAAPLLRQVARLQKSFPLHSAALALLPPAQLPDAALDKVKLELEELKDICYAMKEHKEKMERQQSNEEEFSDAVTTPVIEKKDIVPPAKSSISQPLLYYIKNTLQDKFTTNTPEQSAAPQQTVHCPEFYRSLYPQLAASDDYRYDGFSVPDRQPAKLAVLACYCAHHSLVPDADCCFSDALQLNIQLECAEDYLYQDTPFSTACLLRTSQSPLMSDAFIESHCSNTGLSCLTYAALVKCNFSELGAAAYATPPGELARKTLIEQDVPKAQMKIIRKCIEKLSGAGDGDALRKLGYDVDVLMFNSSPEYRSELIHRVAKSPEEEHALAAFSLAKKYEVDALGVWLAHAGAAVQGARAYHAPPPRDADADAVRRLQSELWPQIAGTDHNALIHYFTALRTLDDKIQIHGLTPSSHVKFLKKVKTCPGIDYKMLINPESPEQLSAHLVRVMCGTEGGAGAGVGAGMAGVARLLRSLPRPLAPPAPLPMLQVQALVHMFFQGGEPGRGHVGTHGGHGGHRKWMQQYRQCASYFNKLDPAALRAFHQAVCFSDDAIARIRSGARALMAAQGAEYCKQERESPHHTATDPSWSEVGQELDAWSVFLDDVAVFGPGLSQCQQILHDIESSRGEHAALVPALWRLCAETSTRFVQAILSTLYMPVDKLAAHALAADRRDALDIETLVDLLIECHKKGMKCDDKIIQDVLDLATEKCLPPQKQIALLSLFDKEVVRETGDVMKVAKYCVDLFRSEWQDCDYVKNVTEEQLLSPQGRTEAFQKLLAASDTWRQNKALVDILGCWPATLNESGRSLQCEFLQSLVSGDNLVLIKLLLPSNSIKPEEMRWISEQSTPESSINVVWAMLLQRHQGYEDDIVSTLSRNKEFIQDQEIDDELIKQLLYDGLFLKLVSTPLYSSIINSIITREAAGGEPSTSYTVKWAMEQLVSTNHFAEAGHLYLTSLGTPAPLLGFSQSVQYARNMFKK